jgi:hypothetical protein
MPRYSLRTLLILLAIGPPLVAWIVPPLVKMLHHERAKSPPIHGLFELTVTATPQNDPQVKYWIQLDASDSP